MYNANSNHRKARVGTFIKGFATKTITGEKEGYFVMIKVSVYQVQMPIVNIHVPKNRTPKYVRQKLTEMEKYNLTIIKKKDFNAPLLIMDRTTKQNKRSEDLNKEIDDYKPNTCTIKEKHLQLIR